jgi:hypothetical protein
MVSVLLQEKAARAWIKERFETRLIQLHVSPCIIC